MYKIDIPKCTHSNVNPLSRIICNNIYHLIGDYISFRKIKHWIAICIIVDHLINMNGYRLKRATVINNKVFIIILFIFTLVALPNLLILFDNLFSWKKKRVFINHFRIESKISCMKNSSHET